MLVFLLASCTPIHRGICAWPHHRGDRFSGVCIRFIGVGSNEDNLGARSCKQLEEMARIALFSSLAASGIADPKCCYSTSGDGSTCGGYPTHAYAGLCSTDYSVLCSSDADCAHVPTLEPSIVPLPISMPGQMQSPSRAPSTGNCCWSNWASPTWCS